MAVITRYVVVRNGVELEKVFNDKKKAEAYDRMLDAAEQLAGLIRAADLDPPVDAGTVEAIAVYLAENGPRVTAILKGVKPVADLERPADADPAGQPVPTRPKPSPRPAKTKPKGD
ncbi:MAG: YebG family protein [Desulfobacterales bacterium]